MKDSNKITFNDLIIPIVCIYTAGLLIYSYFNPGNTGEDSFMEAVVIFTASGFFVYGVLAFFRDLKLFGLVWIIKSFTRWTKGK